jgi:hypothetical protein
MRTVRAVSLLSTVILLAAARSNALANTCTWKKTSASAWDDTTAWNNCGSTYPGSADTVVFDGTGNGECNLDINVTVAAINISNFTGGIVSNPARTLSVTGNYTQSGGTFNANTGTYPLASLVVGGSFTLSGGTFNAPPIVSIAGTFSQSNGTFAGSTSTTNLGGVSLTGGTFSAPTYLIIGGTFSRSAGTFTAGTNAVVLTATSDKTHTFGGTSFNNLGISNGLMAYWRLDETTGATAADASGLGIELTYVGSPAPTSSTASTAFPNTQALAFTKDTGKGLERTSYPQALKGSAWTIAAWFKIASYDTGSCGGSSAAGDGAEIINLADDYGIRLCSDGTVRVFFRRSGDYQDCVSTATFAADGTTWHHAAATYDGATTLKVYLDGTARTCAVSSGQVFSGGTMRAGRHYSNASYDLDGSLDDLRLYNRVLTAVEISALAAGSHPASVAVHTGGGNFSVTGDFALSSASLAGTSATTLDGSWRNFGGIYTASGLVTLGGSGNGKEILSYSQRFAALTLSGSGAWTLLDRLWVDGALTQSAGTLDTASFIVHAGTMNKSAGTLTTGVGTVVVDSASSQTVRSNTALNHLRIESPSESGLIGYWKFDAGNGSTVRDLSGTGNDGTLVGGPSYTTGGASNIGFDNPSALALDGSTQYMTLATASIPATNAAQTIALWIYYTALPGAAKTLVETIDTGASSWGNRLGISSSNELHVWKAASSRGQILATSMSNTTTYPLSTWRHVAYTYDGTTHRLYIDGLEKVTSTSAAGVITPNSVRVGARASGAEYFGGRIDDLRIYNTALSASQVQALAAGRYSGRGGGATFTLGGSATVNGALAVDNGSLATSSYTLAAAASDTSQVAYLNAGGLTIGSTSATFGGGLNVRGAGTLTMNSSGGTLKIANGKTLSIDGVLDASTAGATPTVQCATASSCYYAFTVGSSSTATPTLNIDGLHITQTDTSGLNINGVAGSSTTFTRFDNIAFSGGTGTYHLQIAASALTLYANGLSFDVTSKSKNARLSDTNGSGNDVRLYVGGTCTPLTDCESIDEDDDTKLVDGTTTGSDGTPDDSGNDGAVIQWLYRSHTDTAGTAVGFPASAFDWNTFAYRKTYVAFNNAASSTGRLYARDTDGFASSATYYWSPSAGLNFVASPRFTQEGSNYYVWMVTSNGSVYKIQDTGTALTTVGGYPFRDGASATATSPLLLDTSNVYWAGNNGSGSRKMFSLPQTSTTLNGSGSLSADVTVFPTIATISGTSYIFTAISGTVYKTPSNFGAGATSSQPTTAVSGRVTLFGGILYFVENQGKLWALNSLDLSSNWSYQDTDASRHPGGCTAINQCSSQSIFVQVLTGRVTYGDQDGHVYVVAKNGSSGSLLGGYPYRPGASTDTFTTAPLVTNGIIAIGTSGGKVFLIDQQDASNVPSLIRTYNFRSAVSSISYDRNNASSGEYMITTADGRLFYVSRVSDPTPSYD